MTMVVRLVHLPLVRAMKCAMSGEVLTISRLVSRSACCGCTAMNTTVARLIMMKML